MSATVTTKDREDLGKARHGELLTACGAGVSPETSTRAQTEIAVSADDSAAMTKSESLACCYHMGWTEGDPMYHSGNADVRVASDATRTKKSELLVIQKETVSVGVFPKEGKNNVGTVEETLPK